MSVQSVLLSELNSAFYNRQYTSERLMNSESIKSEGTAVLYLKIMVSFSASVIYKILMSVSKASDTLWFKKKNITDFLKAFNNMCDNYSIESVK